MTTFDERERSFENRFAHDEELRFKRAVRRNWLIANWAAQKMGLDAAKARKYADDLVARMLDPAGDHDIIAKLAMELGIAGTPLTLPEIRSAFARFDDQAREEIGTDSPTDLSR